MADLVLWCGPVSASNLAGVAWQRPTEVITVNHRDWPGAMQGAPRPEIVGSSAFGILAARLGNNPIEAVCAASGRSISDYDRVALVSFSAGHAFVNATLLSGDAHRVNALLALDSYFTSPAREVKAGYLDFILRAARGEVLAAVTTSANGGAGYPPGDVSFAVLAAEVPGLEVIAPPADVPPPVATLGAGNFIWADYELTVPHAGHVHQLAVPWCSSVLAPFMAGQSPGFAGSSVVDGRARKFLRVAAVGGLILGAGFLAYTITQRGRSSNPPPRKVAICTPCGIKMVPRAPSGKWLAA